MDPVMVYLPPHSTHPPSPKGCSHVCSFLTLKKRDRTETKFHKGNFKFSGLFDLSAQEEYTIILYKEIIIL